MNRLSKMAIETKTVFQYLIKSLPLQKFIKNIFIGKCQLMVSVYLQPRQCASF